VTRHGTLESTTSPRRCASGSQRSPPPSAPNRHGTLPVWLARLIAGEAAVLMGTEARGASNAKAEREHGWTPEHYPRWVRPPCDPALSEVLLIEMRG
jgi:hypothetical protein